MNIFKSGSMGTPSMLYFEGTAGEEIKPGEALVLTNGKLTKCAATSVPQYIAQAGGTGVVIPVIRVTPEDTYRAKFTASAASVLPGDKVTLDASGLDITATKTSGVATVLTVFDPAVGGEAEIAFR